MNYDNPEQTTIRGLIVPCDWDNTGNVVSISISTNNEEEFLIDKDSIARKLLPYLRRGIEVNGHISKEKGVKIIRIRQYRIIELSLITK